MPAPKGSKLGSKNYTPPTLPIIALATTSTPASRGQLGMEVLGIKMLIQQLLNGLFQMLALPKYVGMVMDLASESLAIVYTVWSQP